MRKQISFFFLGLLLALAIGAVVKNEEGSIIHYRGGAVLTFDPNVTIKDEDGNWSMGNYQLGVLAAFTNGVISTRYIGNTNYTVQSTDVDITGDGTNQLITLPNCTNTAAGRALTIHAATTTGSLIATNANGVQTIKGGLSISIPATNHLSTINSLVGTNKNWW